MDEEILEMAKSLCKCTDEEETRLKTLCPVCAAQVKSRLRRGVPVEECEDAFVCAAAWLAAAALIETRDGEDVSALRAGDVTISMKGGGRAEALRRAAWRLMEPYTEGGGFYFCGVRG